MYAACAEQRKATAAATSSTVPRRPTGICGTSSSSRPAIILVATARGATQLTVTPRLASSFEAAFVKAKELGVLEERTFGASVRELNDGAVQMYLRDPAGNLVEVDWPDVTTLDRSVVDPIHRLADERPQSDEAQRATLYLSVD